MRASRLGSHSKSIAWTSSFLSLCSSVGRWYDSLTSKSCFLLLLLLLLLADARSHTVMNRTVQLHHTHYSLVCLSVRFSICISPGAEVVLLLHVVCTHLFSSFPSPSLYLLFMTSLHTTILARSCLLACLLAQDQDRTETHLLDSLIRAVHPLVHIHA